MATEIGDDDALKRDPALVSVKESCLTQISEQQEVFNCGSLNSTSSSNVQQDVDIDNVIS